jgi:hypothetical protein
VVVAVLADRASDTHRRPKGWRRDVAETLRTNARAAEALITDNG